ncbi:MAG: hypothetical protein V2I46_12970 [Bacteroides sp.]|jgi:tRNA-dihydrouridine synthase|nr:hypothetical protein [Bacteroides sp.]
MKTLLAQLDVFERNWGNEKHFSNLRRLFKIYLNGFVGAAELRHRMMQVNHFSEARSVMDDYRNLVKGERIEN